ncbi:hypothetical protein GCM10010495_08130 [Kitasatospora herbaricolor]|nr:hypothetical protein GCM10010495_08130 [Kitasatospora herbaricolor]
MARTSDRDGLGEPAGPGGARLCVPSAAAGLLLELGAEVWSCRAHHLCGRLPPDPHRQVAAWAALGTARRWGAHFPSGRFWGCWGSVGVATGGRCQAPDRPNRPPGPTGC